ncbi:MAG: hypothetical protein L0Z62_13780 [Gemmataceae bacterium]|nr:hypothetical protein [Gemmataceae bacterium]
MSENLQAGPQPPEPAPEPPTAPPIELPDLYGGSLWLRFLYEGLGRFLTVPGACLLWAVVQAGLFATLCASQGTLWADGSPGRMALVEDTTALAYYFLLPVCFLLLYYSLLLFRRYLNRLDEVLEPSSLPASKARLLEIARASFGPGIQRTRWVFVAFGLLVFLFNAIANLYPEFFYDRPHKWDGIAYPANYVVARLYVLFVWGYVLPTWAAEVYMQLRVMTRISGVAAESGWLKVSPYHHDQFGGLGGLALAASWVGYLILIAGVFFLAPLLRAVLWGQLLHVGNYIGLGVYVLFTSAGLFLPVYLLHRILAKKREDMLRFLGGAFDGINERVAVLVKADNVQGLADESLGRALETVDRLRTQWAALPIWPFSLAQVAQYLVMVLPPVVVFALQQSLKQIQN